MRKPGIVILTGSVLVFLACFVVQISGSLESLELLAYDLFVALRPKLLAEESKITIIEISETDIRLSAAGL